MKGCKWVARAYNGKDLHKICEAHGTDHGQVMVDELNTYKLPPIVSHACENPTAEQSVILPRDRIRRHPYSGERPQWSGYCVVEQCTCECHRNEPIDENELEEI